MDAPHVAIDDEAALGRTVRTTMVASVPLVFIVSTLICLPGAGSVKIAALIALVPTAFTVPFVGALIGLSITQFRQDANRRLVAANATGEPVDEVRRVA